MGKGLSITSWNVRSLLNKIDSIRYEVAISKPDILNISESWLHINIDDKEISINGYIITRLDRSTYADGTIKKGGGLCKYIKQGLVSENIETMQLCDNDIEMMCNKVKLPYTRDIYILKVYRPACRKCG